MTGSMKGHVGKRNALSVFVVLASYFACITAATGQQNLQVINLTSTSTPGEVSDARAAFAKGQAIVRMVGGSSADFNRLLGVQIPDSKAFTQTSNNPGASLGTQSGSQLKLQAIAAYVDGNGILRSMLSHGPDGESWQKQMDQWVAGAQSKAATTLQEGDSPEPPPDAWTLLYTTTVGGCAGDAGCQQSTNNVYRLNTTSSKSDFYLVYTVPQTTPGYDNYCDGIARCGWHTIERDFEIDGNGGSLADHGPTGTITESETGFEVGGEIGPEGPGVSAGFSASWSTPSVTTVDHSNNLNASWQEQFKFSGVACLPVVNTIPPVSTGTFLSRQAAIFEVEGGTSSVSFPITTKSEFCAYVGPPYDPAPGYSLGPNYSWIISTLNFPLGPPLLQALPASLTIPAGGTAPLLVNAYIPNSEQGLAWTISSNQLWVTVPSHGPFTTGQAIPVTVAPGTANGTPGATLSINTSPPFAAPSVITGPIQVNVTVGTPKEGSAAGILLFGGDSFDIAEYYDLASKVAAPVTPNLSERFRSTATLLNTGDILIAGGITIAGSFPPGTPLPVTATAELFHAGSLTFSNTTGSLTTARAKHTATLLPDGKVLIVGGVDANGNSLASAELYDPATGTFSNAGSLQTPRSSHYASLFSQPPGPTQVMIYGGSTSDVTKPDDGWELWDEGKNAFIGSGSMLRPAFGIPQPVAFVGSSAGLTRFALVGGENQDGQITASTQYLWTNGLMFQPGLKMNVPRTGHTLTNLPNGAGLLVTGGVTPTNDPSNPQALASAELGNLNVAPEWNLLSDTATCPGNPGCMVAARALHTATLLPDGTVLLVGGNVRGGPTTEIYYPASKTFTAGPILRPRSGHTATLVVTTVTSLIATPSPSAFGQSVNLAATVTSGFGTPTGSVHFLDGSTDVGSAGLANGQASISLSTLSIGSHALKAVYAGDGVSSASVSPVVTQVVGGTTTTTSLSLSPNPSQFGSAVTMTASVSGTGGPATGGTVVFSDAGQQIASADLASGSASAQLSTLSVGQHAITATYSGNGNWQGSTSATVSQVVTAMKVSTTTTITSNNNPSTSGQPVTFQAQVTPLSGTGVPTGTVNFLDGSTVLGSGNLVSGTANFTTSSLAEGTHTIVGTYLGDTSFSVSTSSVLTQTVSSGGGKVTPTVDLTVNGSSSGATVSVGDTVTFMARIHAAANYPWPTGSITISDSTNANNRYGSANITKDPNSNDGLATITNSGIAAGSYTLIATYGGDNEGKYYNGAQSNMVSLTVKPTLGAPPPRSSVVIQATTGARNGTLMLVSLTVTNNGNVPVSGVALNQISLRTLAGTGDAALFAPTFPVIVGDLQPGASTVLTLELQVPTTVEKLALSEYGTLQDAGGKVYQFDYGQVLFP